MRKYPHIAARIYGTPLMIDPEKLDVIVHALGPRLGAEEAPAPAADFGDTQKPSEKEYKITADGIAIIPVEGSLVNRSGWMDALSGLTSYEQLTDWVEDAATDPAVKGILLRIDSFGGEVAGSFDVADKIAAAAKLKPTVAMVDDFAFSAAYLLASAAGKIIITRTSGVGSIGVIMRHVDQSGFDEQMGVKFTNIKAGAKKDALDPHKPLSDAAKAEAQAEVDRIYEMFVSSVAKRRKMSVEAVKATQAGLFFGQNAIDAGLADQIATRQDALGIVNALAQRERSTFTISNVTIDGATSEPIKLYVEGGSISRVEASAESTDITKEKEGIMPDPNKADVQETTTSAIPQAVPIDAKAIADLCIIAGKKDLVADFIAKGMTVDQVRQELIDSRVKESEASQTNGSHAGLGQSAEGAIQAKAAAFLAGGAVKTKEQAYAAALDQNPALYDAYLKANPAQIGGR